MFEFFGTCCSRRGNPIGIDFGGDAVRLAQVQPTETGHRLDAAASCEWDAAQRKALEFHAPPAAAEIAGFAAIIRRLAQDGAMAGRHAIVALPARWTSLVSLQLPPMRRRNFQIAIQAAARDKLGYDPADAVMRALTLGESDAIAGAMRHILLVAAPRRRVQAMLEILAAAKLRILSLVPEPAALVEAYRRIYRRADESRRTCALIDIGGGSTRLIVSRAGALLHASRIEIGAHDFAETLAAEARTSIGDARLARMKAIAGADGMDDVSSVAVAAPARTAPVDRLVERLRGAIDAFAAVSDRPVEELIFTGGQARQEAFCQSIAAGIGLPHRIGDPLARINRDSRVAVTAGIDRRQPQPQWALAVGLSMGVSTHRNSTA